MSDNQKPRRNGLCVTAYELGFTLEYLTTIVYPHPDCELHGGTLDE